MALNVDPPFKSIQKIPAKQNGKTNRTKKKIPRKLVRIDVLFANAKRFPVLF